VRRHKGGIVESWVTGKEKSDRAAPPHEQARHGSILSRVSPPGRSRGNTK
jgi:hypothetical protein